MPKFFSLFKSKDAVLTNREPAKGSGAGGIAIAKVKSKTPNDPVANLTLDKIDSTYRKEVEQKGLFSNSAYALSQMSRLVPPLAEVFNFWSSQLSTLDWEIKTIDGAEEKQAQRQKEAVEKRFNDFKNLKTAIKHLAQNRFFGFSACKIFPDSLAIVSPWSVSQNLQWTGNTPPDYGYYLNPDNLYSPDFSKLEKVSNPDYVLCESDNSILLALLRLALKYREADDAFDMNLERAGTNQILVTTPPQSSLSDEQKSKLEQMLLALSEGNSGWLEEISESSPIKIQRIEPCPALTLYKDRLAILRTDIISLVSSSTLNQQTGATGLGSNVAEQHSNTLKTLVIQDSGVISEALDMAITIPTLLQSGIIDPTETPLVYFSLSQRKENDSKGALELAKMARDAGVEIPLEKLTEQTGLELQPYEASQVPAGLPQTLTNAEPSSPSAYLSKEELEGIDAPLLKAIENLTKKWMDDEKPIDEAFISSLQDAIKKLPLELVDVSAIEERLTEEMQKAVKGTLSKKVSKVIKNRRQKGE